MDKACGLKKVQLGADENLSPEIPVMGSSGGNYVPAFASTHLAVSACPQKVEICGPAKIINTNYNPASTDEEDESNPAQYMTMTGKLTR